MPEPPAPGTQDGYPAPPLGGTLADLQRYESISVLAEALRIAEDVDIAMIYGEPNCVPRATPAYWWAKAEAAYDQRHAEQAKRDKAAVELAERMANDPELARIEAVFAAAKEACRIGHPAGCTYGGMSASHGYWLADSECDLNHGKICDLKAACDGVEAVTGFVGRDPEDWIWAVAACQPCADHYVAAHPEHERNAHA